MKPRTLPGVLTAPDKLVLNIFNAFTTRKKAESNSEADVVGPESHLFPRGAAGSARIWTCVWGPGCAFLRRS